MAAKSPRELIEDFLAAISSSALEKVSSMTSDDLAWSVVGTGSLAGTLTKEGYLALLAGVTDVLDGPLTMTPKGWTIEGDRVAVEVDSHARLKDGRIYSNHYHFLFQIREGRVARVREYMDTLHVEKLFGTLKEVP